MSHNFTSAKIEIVCCIESDTEICSQNHLFLVYENDHACKNGYKSFQQSWVINSRLPSNFLSRFSFMKDGLLVEYTILAFWCHKRTSVSWQCGRCEKSTPSLPREKSSTFRTFSQIPLSPIIPFRHKSTPFTSLTSLLYHLWSDCRIEKTCIWN